MSGLHRVPDARGAADEGRIPQRCFEKPVGAEGARVPGCRACTGAAPGCERCTRAGASVRAGAGCPECRARTNADGCERALMRPVHARLAPALLHLCSSCRATRCTRALVHPCTDYLRSNRKSPLFAAAPDRDRRRRPCRRRESACRRRCGRRSRRGGGSIRRRRCRPGGARTSTARAARARRDPCRCAP